jgi:hypothetical protein
MRSKHWLFFTIILLCPVGRIHAQAWSGIIASSRAIDWTQAGVPGGIPSNRTQCGSTIAPYSGSASNINAAIASCGTDQFVLLGAGTFNLSDGILINAKNNVSLRGAGPDQTFVKFTNGNNCMGVGADVCISNGDNNDCGGCGGPANAASWTGGYAQGTTSITLGSIVTGSTSALKVGQMIFLDQLDDSNIDTGQVWICQTANVCSTNPGSQNGRPGRGQQQAVKVTAISGSGPWTVTITPGIYMPNWRSSQTPQAWWSANQPITGVGIESLSLDHTNTALSNSAAAGIAIFNGYGNWIQNIRGITSPHEQVNLYQSARTTIQNNYFYGTKNDTSQSYGTNSYNGGDNLFLNNIYQHIATSMINEGCEGCAFLYNFAIDDWYTANGSAPTWQQGAMYHHSVGDAYVLWEGNQAPMFVADDIHGTSHFFTLFRNYLHGHEPGKNQQTTPLIIEAYSRYYNIVGNVLGTPGYHTNYQVLPLSAVDGGSTSAADASVYSLGYSGNQGTLGGFSNDIFLPTAVMRWGNYDTANAAVRFVTSEVPNLLGLLGNPLPPSQALPASFVFSGRPSWWSTPWGSPPWPANGPDVTGGSIAGLNGHASNLPAALCYLNSPVDPGYPGAADRGVLLFNANKCYGSQSAGPAAPSNLSAIVN